MIRLRFEEQRMTGPCFQRYVGIDYSGAKSPEASLPGIRVYLAEGNGDAEEILPPPGAKKYWSRRSLAEWLSVSLSEPVPSLVGIDHGFSFPLAYFEAHGLAGNWTDFLDDFHLHWPTDEAHMYVDFVRDGVYGRGAARGGNARWRRLCEKQVGAKSVFHFDVPGSVAKSTHAGLPWLRQLRHGLGARIHCWPFDGWDPQAGVSMLTEIYPSLWSKAYPRKYRTQDQQDAYSTAMWLREMDKRGQLPGLLRPSLSDREREVAEIEGWILGVPGTVEGCGNQSLG